MSRNTNIQHPTTNKIMKVLFYFSTNMMIKNKDREIIAAWRRLSMFSREREEIDETRVGVDARIKIKIHSSCFNKNCHHIQQQRQRQQQQTKLRCSDADTKL